LFQSDHDNEIRKIEYIRCLIYFYSLRILVANLQHKGPSPKCCCNQVSVLGTLDHLLLHHSSDECRCEILLQATWHHVCDLLVHRGQVDEAEQSTKNKQNLRKEHTLIYRKGYMV
jgi:hypothetical protein